LNSGDAQCYRGRHPERIVCGGRFCYCCSPGRSAGVLLSSHSGNAVGVGASSHVHLGRRSDVPSQPRSMAAGYVPGLLRPDVDPGAAGIFEILTINVGKCML